MLSVIFIFRRIFLNIYNIFGYELLRSNSNSTHYKINTFKCVVFVLQTFQPISKYFPINVNDSLDSNLLFNT